MACLRARGARRPRRHRAGDEVLVLTWLDRARRDVLRVHPRGDASRSQQGVFSTRSPHRPNPIGLHRVEIVSIDGGRVRVRRLEAVDGTRSSTSSRCSPATSASAERVAAPAWRDERASPLARDAAADDAQASRATRLSLLGNRAKEKHDTPCRCDPRFARRSSLASSSSLPRPSPGLAGGRTAA